MEWTERNTAFTVSSSPLPFSRKSRLVCKASRSSPHSSKYVLRNCVSGRLRPRNLWTYALNQFDEFLRAERFDEPTGSTRRLAVGLLRTIALRRQDQIGTARCCDPARTFLISEMPSMFGMLRSVMIRSNFDRRARSAPLYHPLLRQLRIRLSQRERDMSRMVLESSTVNIRLAIQIIHFENCDCRPRSVRALGKHPTD